LSERKKRFLGRFPNNCVHNKKTRIRGNGTVGICDHPEKIKLFSSGVFVCDTKEICDKCPYFLCSNTEESVESDFREVLRDTSLGGQEYPKIVTLLWVLAGKESKEPSCLMKFWNFLKGKRCLN